MPEVRRCANCLRAGSPYAQFRAGVMTPKRRLPWFLGGAPTASRRLLIEQQADASRDRRELMQRFGASSQESRRLQAHLFLLSKTLKITHKY